MKEGCRYPGFAGGEVELLTTRLSCRKESRNGNILACCGGFWWVQFIYWRDYLAERRGTLGPIAFLRERCKGKTEEKYQQSFLCICNADRAWVSSFIHTILVVIKTGCSLSSYSFAQRMPPIHQSPSTHPSDSSLLVPHSIRCPPLNANIPNPVFRKHPPNIILVAFAWRRHIDITQHQTLLDLRLHSVNIVQPPPTPARLLLDMLPAFLTLAPVSVRIARQDDQREFCMRERRAAVVQQIVDTEFDTTSHDPAQRAVMVVHRV